MDAHFRERSPEHALSQQEEKAHARNQRGHDKGNVQQCVQYPFSREVTSREEVGRGHPYQCGKNDRC